MYQISSEIIQKTTDCEKDFACLKNGNAEMCGIDYVDGESVSFLKTNEPASCPYRLVFGFKQVCSCPVRFQLYKKYQK